jgi:hypothetical protein
MQANKLKVLATAVALALPVVAQAESTIATTPASGSMSTSARVNINVVIPRFLFLQVGTGTLLTNVGTIDTVVFNVPVANINNGTPVVGTGGDLTGGRVTVRLLGNVGNVNLSATAPALTNGTGETLPWSEISVATSGPTHPAINGAAAAYTATARVVNVSGDWTYGYLNSNGAPVAEGTYASQITYTAVSL